MTATDWLRFPGDACDIATVGTKAHNLSRLVAAGFDVPRSVFLPVRTAVENRFPDQAAYLRAITALAVDLPTLLPSDSGWAVRSSATIEDLADLSQAGRFETVFIDKPDELAGGGVACLGVRTTCGRRQRRHGRRTAGQGAGRCRRCRILQRPDERGRRYRRRRRARSRYQRGRRQRPAMARPGNRRRPILAIRHRA